MVRGTNTMWLLMAPDGQVFARGLRTAAGVSYWNSSQREVGRKCAECATMMTFYLLLLTVRMTRIITTVILTEAHRMVIWRTSRLHVSLHEAISSQVLKGKLHTLAVGKQTLNRISWKLKWWT
nr:PREDICTED: uncharacterized protein LOC103544348 isoform X2 [Equus przewalskii]